MTLEKYGKRLVMTGLCLGVLAGCDQIGNPIDVMQGRVKTPDEFEVVARKPLQMPATRALPEPQLGVRSPLDPDPNADARAVLLGGGATATIGTISASESALLGAADAAAARPNIRAALQEDQARQAEGDAYEVPSLFELFDDEGQPVKDALDADAEARRLQSEGIASAPINPDGAPGDEDVETRPEAATPAYPREGRRPNNQLGKDAQQPLFN